MAADANPNLAIWISAIGFFSTLVSGLVVAIINSRTTLKGKEIDAQLKKDEQAYGFKMEYLKRKLTAGEKAIGKINILITSLATTKRSYVNFLNNIDTSEASWADVQAFETKLLEVNSQTDDYYYAYFPIDDEEEDKFVILMDTLNDLTQEIHDLNDEFNNNVEEHQKENPDTEDLPDNLLVDDEYIKSRVSLYIKTTDELIVYLTDLTKNINKQIENSINLI